jgi:hypothetical protein
MTVWNFIVLVAIFVLIMLGCAEDVPVRWAVLFFLSALILACSWGGIVKNAEILRKPSGIVGKIYEAMSEVPVGNNGETVFGFCNEKIKELK